jgi:hypothetical protein
MSKAENMTTDEINTSAPAPAAEFDPGEYTVAEVIEHLDANPNDAARILEAEQSGKARKGVLEYGNASGPTDYLGRTVTSSTDQLGRDVEDGADYLGRAIG